MQELWRKRGGGGGGRIFEGGVLAGHYGMLWAAGTMCLFGFLRVGEIAVPSINNYDAGAHLSVGDVTLENREQPSLVQVTIKTDPLEREW